MRADEVKTKDVILTVGDNVDNPFRSCRITPGQIIYLEGKGIIGIQVENLILWLDKDHIDELFRLEEG